MTGCYVYGNNRESAPSEKQKNHRTCFVTTNKVFTTHWFLIFFIRRSLIIIFHGLMMYMIIKSFPDISSRSTARIN